MPVSRRLRFEIFRRDDHACRYCGARAPDVSLTVDHVVPVALGGDDKPENLVTACAACNSGKSSVPADAPLVANVADDAIRWGKAMEFAAGVRERERAVTSAYCAAFLEVWQEWTYSNGEQLPLPEDWRTSIARFCVLGIDCGLLIEWLPRAIKRGTRGRYGEFNYLCGMCWREMDERQEIAAEQITRQETEGIDDGS